MAVTYKPHIFIIPGAWHTGPSMNDFVKSLETAGFSAEAVTLVSIDKAGMTVQDDEAQVKGLLRPMIDEGRDIVLVAHSYGGMVGTGVIAGLDERSRRAKGLKGGILGVVYLTAFVPAEDESSGALLGGAGAAYVNTEKLETEGVYLSRNEGQSFYNDCSPDAIERVKATLKPHSAVAGGTCSSAIGWRERAYDGRRAYIRCLRDNALPIAVQDRMVARSGVEWVVKTVNASHSPFVSMPDELAGVVAGIVEEFEKD